MKTNFGERFKSARLMNGLSLQDVADQLSKSVTRQAIYRYEKGEVIPDSTTLHELCKLFNVQSDFFFRPIGVAIKDINYRKLRTSAKEDDKIREHTKDYLSRYLEIEDILGIKNAFENPLKGFPEISKYAHVNHAANLLREAWNLGNNALPNVSELLEDQQIKVIELDAHGNFDGLQTYANNNIPVIAYNINKTGNPDRLRFTLLHELAHLLLTFDESLTKHEVERLCNQFAAAMLISENTLKNELGEKRKQLSIHEIGNIKKQYGISMQAIVLRAHDCGIITANYTSQFFKKFKDNDWTINEPISYEGHEKSGRFEQLVFRALIEELISQSKAAGFLNISVAELRTRIKKYNAP